ncbi:unnamed protein product [Zymoseptoria tritici ST99CH_1E4]|uniref:Uncharacterized protein n=1 Tax=Zymoseptoria tritici ST99CH_1E4 TaxID=1276532 RepID=A0A2H1GAR8_ZYMTR|nr:unnamed protein product [Zymoseptoria tritici ST99CH_1E4]
MPKEHLLATPTRLNALPPSTPGQGKETQSLWACCYSPKRNAQHCTHDYSQRYDQSLRDGPLYCHYDSNTNPQIDDGFWACIANPN